MAEPEIISRVNQVFQDSFEIDADQLQPQKRIFEDLGLDSLDIVDLVVAMQKEFGMSIRSDERIKRIRTLGDIYTWIHALKTEGSNNES